jgi:hypothetical protein
MGIRLFSKDGYGDSYPVTDSTGSAVTKNPNPDNWIILSHQKVGKLLVVKIKYPDCDNYEGEKILVYENITLAKLRKQVKIDPHFSENKEYKSPIARFVPTDRGWDMAITFCEALSND